ncbi:hypothetical protein FOZ60_013041 [Perkinsus olseni]|uniref:Uncharacterized protein n=2 Tax=Perkinsus olseni TaxID=32597 RepID=A0A7J6P9K7_PEROL|nr:hypothetical protein FOZ60_013041 [Perkinsus olseni]
MSQWHEVLPNRAGATAHRHLASILKESVTAWTEQADVRRFWESFVVSPPSLQATMGPFWQTLGIEALADDVRQKWIQYLSSEGWATTEALETRASAKSPLYPVLMETLLRVTSPIGDHQSAASDDDYLICQQIMNGASIGLTSVVAESTS